LAVTNSLCNFGQLKSKMKFATTFGETVKKLREDRNLTLREVASKLKIDTSMLGKIEKNNRKANKLLIGKFAKFFKVSNKDLTIAFLSDKIVYEVLEEENFAAEVLKVAEKKMKYLNGKKEIKK
jgi:HTH-type transcriptional regulator, competence development regulator